MPAQPPGSPLRLAMWSGPRNISTAMMRSWGHRADTFVCDEPLYAHYLQATRKPHPAADRIIARYETDWKQVVAWLTGEVPEGKRIFFQKHMAHHLLPGMGREWLAGVTNCFLIRDPREMLTSLLKVLHAPELEDTGLVQQVEIFELVRARTGQVPPVLDARNVLDDPRGVLGRLCERLGVAFDEAMLSWPAGRRDTDGIWAEHWYHEVETSTSFRPYRPKHEEVPDRFAGLYRRCQECYERLAAHRVTA